MFLGRLDEFVLVQQRLRLDLRPGSDHPAYAGVLVLQDLEPGPGDGVASLSRQRHYAAFRPFSRVSYAFRTFCAVQSPSGSLVGKYCHNGGPAGPHIPATRGAIIDAIGA